MRTLGVIVNYRLIISCFSSGFRGLKQRIMIPKRLELIQQTEEAICEFPLSCYFKAKLGANSLIWKWFCIRGKQNSFSQGRFALSLVLKVGVLGTRKCIPIQHYLWSVKVERLLNLTGFSLFAKHLTYTLKRGGDIKVQEGSDSSKETKERNLDTSKA